MWSTKKTGNTSRYISNNPAMNTETIEQTFSVTTPAQLSLSNLRGRVVVLAGDPAGHGAPAAIAVSATKYLDTGDAEQTRITMRQDPDGHVVVITEHETLDHTGFHKPCRVEYLVRVPRLTSATLSCITCRQEISGLQGEFRLKSVSGEILLKDLEGPIEVSNVSGDVQGERLSGKGLFETTSGQIRLTQGDFPTLKATSVSGGIYVQTTQGAGVYRFKTISGDVTLVLPEGSGYRAELRSISGKLLTAGTPAHTGVRGGQRFVEVGSASSTIQAETVSGNLGLPGKPLSA